MQTTAKTEDMILQLVGIKKYFPGVKALDGVDFSLRKGEVHAILGENGAGKSTLIKVITGIYSADAGEIIIKGNKVEMHGVNDAINNHIAAIHQELCLLPYRSVAANIFLGRELKKKNGMMDDHRMNEETQDLLDSLGLPLRADELVVRYSIAQQQLVEIAKALAWKAEILIMDEPTSSLTQKEVDKLFEIIDSLKKKGTSIIYISHRMEELFAISDRVTVLRDGQYIDTRVTKEATKDELVEMMVGRTLTDYYTKDSSPEDQVLFQVKKFTKKGVFQDIDLTVHKGEILGVSGMVGSGRTEVARAIVGIDPKDNGTVTVDGKEIDIRSPIDAIRAGIVLIPENRKEQGLVLVNSVRFNTTITVLSEFLHGIRYDRKKENSLVKDSVDKLKIRTPDYEQYLGNLSGGNQQKVVLAKWLRTNPKVLIMDEPTRGVDVGAKVEIYTIMNELAKQGVAIIMISSELSEVINMSDRVVVMRQGKVVGELKREELSQEKIMQFAV